MKLSIQLLLDCAKKKDYASLLCAGVKVRCDAQLLNLKKLALTTSSRRHNVSSGIDSLRALYTDTLEFADVVASRSDIKNADSSTNFKKFVLNKFEYLDARHSTVIETFSEVVRSVDNSNRDEELIKSFLKHQISTSTILQHGFILSSKKFHHRHGCVRYDCDLLDICEGVKEHAVNLADHNIDRLCPVINVRSNLEQVGRDEPSSLKIDCIPSIIQFIILELVKNAIYATLLQSSMSTKDFVSPMIDIIVEDSDVDLSISVLDRGIGILEKDFENISKFAYSVNDTSNASNPLITQPYQASYQPHSAPLQGFGAGLSVSILYAQMFGGALTLKNREDTNGVCATLRISKDLSMEETL